MAAKEKTTSRKGEPVETTYGKDAVVRVKNVKSLLYNRLGIIETGHLTPKGQQNVKFRNGDTHLIMANDLELFDEEEQPEYRINWAMLAAGVCNFEEEWVKGPYEGQKAKVEGPGTYFPEMQHAFGRLNAHLACIDDRFKFSGIEIDDIGNFETHEVVGDYHVSGIRTKGDHENEQVMLIGSKFVSCGGRISIQTPWIPLDELSSYRWKNELHWMVRLARAEVIRYKEGHFEPIEKKEPKEKKGKKNKNQMTIVDMLDPENAGKLSDNGETGEDIGDHFENNREK